MRIILLIISFFIFASAFAQKYKISGIVKDDSTGQPLSSVSLSIVRAGTMANKNGEFELIAKKGDIIHFTRIGYSRFDYTIQQAAVLEIQLKRQASIVELSLERYSFRYRGTIFTTPDVFYGKLTVEKFSDDSISIPPPPKPAPGKLIEDETKIFEKVEVAPSIKDVDTSQLLRLLAKDIKVRGHRSGKLKLRFIVTPYGITNVTTLVPFKKGVDEQVVRNLNSIRTWQYAIQNGRNVDVLCELSFNVVIEKRLLVLTFNHE